MPRRPEDFTEPIKRVLAQRVGYRCSVCLRLTSGPSSDGTSLNTGIGCHIKGAKPDAKRYDPNQTPDERRSQENGIWTCAICSKVIDTDDVKFTVDYLLNLKGIAEQRAELDQRGTPAAAPERRSSERNPADFAFAR